MIKGLLGSFRNFCKGIYLLKKKKSSASKDTPLNNFIIHPIELNSFAVT